MKSEARPLREGCGTALEEDPRQTALPLSLGGAVSSPRPLWFSLLPSSFSLGWAGLGEVINAAPEGAPRCSY